MAAPRPPRAAPKSEVASLGPPAAVALAAGSPPAPASEATREADAAATPFPVTGTAQSLALDDAGALSAARPPGGRRL
jgi:hypothetical protein